MFLHLTLMPPPSWICKAICPFALPMVSSWKLTICSPFNQVITWLRLTYILILFQSPIFRLLSEPSSGCPTTWPTELIKKTTHKIPNTSHLINSMILLNFTKRLSFLTNYTPMPTKEMRFHTMASWTDSLAYWSSFINRFRKDFSKCAERVLETY